MELDKGVAYEASAGVLVIRRWQRPKVAAPTSSSMKTTPRLRSTAQLAARIALQHAGVNESRRERAPYLVQR